jgi:beta-mannosidase
MFFTASRALLESDSVVVLTIKHTKGLAEVFVGEHLAGRITNEFIPFEAVINDFLGEGQNKISIRFTPFFQQDTNSFAKRYNVLPGEPRVLYRQAQYSFGWDFASPDLTPSFSGFNICVKAAIKPPASYCVITDSIKRDTAFLTLEAGKRKYLFTIPQPILWYPNGIETGAYLYRLPVKTIAPSESEIDTIVFGIRTIKLVRERDTVGESFYFEVNQKPVFAKGANFILLQTETDTNLLLLAKEANMNMLRLWGGSRYADETMLKWCDENGILLWQDFPFACALYPATDDFLEEVKREAKYNLERLMGHPSLALLCGNNEIWEGINHWGWKHQVDDTNIMITNYNRLFKELLPSVIQEVCPEIDYIHSSPLYHGWGNPISMKRGDSHYWGIWHGDSCFETYTRKVGRFMSEYGFASPSITKPEHGSPKIDTMISRMYGGYTSDSDYYAKAHQAAVEAYTIAIEAHRRNKPYCMGSLLWQFNEPKPSLSWACIDGSGQPKPVYYAIKQAFEPLILSVDVFSCEDSVKIYYCNDTEKEYDVQRLNIVLYQEDGTMLWGKTYKNIHISAERSQCVLAVAYSDMKFIHDKPVLVSATIFQPDLNLSATRKTEIGNHKF